MAAVEFSARDTFLKVAWSLIHSPYIWGGDDPKGFDCSGYVIECLQSVGLIDRKIDMTADDLMRHFASHTVRVPKAGALLFRLNTKGKAYHVVICLNSKLYIGADGGDAEVVSEDIAWRRNAYIKVRPIERVRDRDIVIDPFT